LEAFIEGGGQSVVLEDRSDYIGKRSSQGENVRFGSAAASGEKDKSNDRFALS
jgi:hypothetical protein